MSIEEPQLWRCVYLLTPSGVYKLLYYIIKKIFIFLLVIRMLMSNMTQYEQSDFSRHHPHRSQLPKLALSMVRPQLDNKHLTRHQAVVEKRRKNHNHVCLRWICTISSYECYNVFTCYNKYVFVSQDVRRDLRFKPARDMCLNELQLKNSTYIFHYQTEPGWEIILSW